MLDTNYRKYAQPIIKVVANFFIKLNWTANEVTVLSLLVGLVSAVVFYFNYNILALILLWVSGLLDAVDGTIAREKGSTPFGTIMDLAFDRIVEIGIIISLSLKPHVSKNYLVFLACSIILSMTIFLSTGIMSKKESTKSFYYQAGLMERTEGFIMFSMMIVFPSYANVFINIFTVGIMFTVVQRFREASKILK